MRALGAVPLDVILNPFVFSMTTEENAKSIGQTGLRFVAGSRCDLHFSAKNPWPLPLYENKCSPYSSFEYKPGKNNALVVVNASAAMVESGIDFFIHGTSGVVTFQEIPLKHICEIFVMDRKNILTYYVTPGVRELERNFARVHELFGIQVEQRREDIVKTLDDFSLNDADAAAAKEPTPRYDAVHVKLPPPGITGKPGGLYTVEGKAVVLPKSNAIPAGALLPPGNRANAGASSSTNNPGAPSSMD